MIKGSTLGYCVGMRLVRNVFTIVFANIFANTTVFFHHSFNGCFSLNEVTVPKKDNEVD